MFDDYVGITRFFESMTFVSRLSPSLFGSLLSQAFRFWRVGEVALV